MSHFNFVIKTGKLIEAGNVQRSIFGTAGRFTTATPDGLGDFAVFDDTTGNLHRCKSGMSAAAKWHSLNRACLKARQ
jgi:hypothetical protein